EGFRVTTTIEDSVDASSTSMFVTSCPTKLKAEFEPEEAEESDDENEEEGEAKTEERKAETDYLKVPEWDVDSFDGLEPSDHYKGITPMKLESRALRDKNYRQFWEDMVYVCLQKLNQDKSYITFMAREKPDGPIVEYQAKCMVTLDRKRHPILCRPAPSPKP
ncbi:hypothetical protein CARUB_v10003894mg, partial [Capsella rubella]